MQLAPAPQAFDNLVFDLDGTLVDSAPGIVAALSLAMAAVLPDAVVRVDEKVIGPPIREVFRRLLGEVDAAAMERLVAYFRAAYDGPGCLESRLYDTVAETLADLGRRNIRCFVLTNKPTLPTRRILAHFGLLEHFVDTLSPDGLEPPFRTKTEGAMHLMRVHGLSAARSALVGDSADDLEAAEACGMGFIPVAYGYGGIHVGREPVLTRFGDLLGVAQALT